MNIEFEDNIPIPKADDGDKDDKNYDTDKKQDTEVVQQQEAH